MTRLGLVIDPESDADVIRMRLVEDLSVNAQGEANYTFRPSLPFCPLAAFLVQQIKSAVPEVSQKIKITGFVASDELTTLINKEN